MASKPEKAKSYAATTELPTSMEDIFTVLNNLIQRSDYEQVIKAADQVLAFAPGDAEAIRCKVVALIKTDRIDDALRAIDSCKMSSIDVTFFKAYCLYRQNQLDGALDCLKGCEKKPETWLLESQILYRLGKVDVSVDIYEKLQNASIGSLEINLIACLILVGRASEVQGMLEAHRIKAFSSFELAYNTACALMETCRYADAEQLLLAARRIGQETLMEDNFSENDIEVELAPIAVQLACVLQHQGRTREAREAYEEIISRNLADESSIAVAVNNLVALKGTRDASNNLKKLDLLKDKDACNFQLARGLDKLSATQREAIYANRVLLLLHANKLDQARELVEALAYVFSENAGLVLLKAALFVRESKIAEAERVLDEFAERFCERSRDVLLVRAQVAAMAGHHEVAASSLAKVSDIVHMPATVATIVSLKELAGDVDGASMALDSAIQWWSGAMAEDQNLGLIMQKAALFKLRHGLQEDAARLYKVFFRCSGSVEALVGLVSTLSSLDVDQAEEYEKQLQPFPELEKLDLDALEKNSGGIANVFEGLIPGGLVEGRTKEKPKKKRKRKPRYPKGFDPANPGPPPDPERWLPLRERSSYRPKRKDKRSAPTRGSQGAVIRDKHEASVVSSTPSSQATTSKSNARNATASSKPSSRPSKKKWRK